MATATQIGLTATLDISDFQRSAATYMRTLQQMQTAAGQSTTSINNSFSQAGSMGGGLIPTLDSIGKGFLAIGAAATAAAVGGIAMFASSSIQMASGLEQSMADIAAIMGQTTAEIEPLGTLIKELAIDPNLKVSFDEASEAAMTLAKSGIHMEEQMGGALRGVIEGVNATGASYDYMARAVGTTLDVFRMESSQATHVVDGMVGVLNNSRMSVTDYTYAVNNAGAVMRQFGVSSDQFNAILVSTRGEFSSGRTQGTGYSNMLRALTAPTDKAAGVMAQLGITVADENGRFKELFQIIEEVQGSLSKLSQAEQSAAMQTIFGTYGRQAFSAVLGLNKKDLDELTISVNRSGQAAAAAEVRMFTLESQFEAFKDLVGATAISIGSMFVPILRDAFIEVNNYLNPLGKSFDQFGLSGVANTLKLSDAAVQMATSIDESFSKLAATLSTGNITATLEQMGFNVDYLTTGLYALTGAVAGLMILGTVAATVFATSAAIAALSNPIGQAIAGVALLGAAWNTNFLHIQDITMWIYDRITTTLSQLGTITRIYIERWINLFRNGATAIYDGLSAVFFALPTPVQQAMSQVYDIVVGVMNSAIEYVNSALSSISSAAGGYVPEISLPSISGLAFPDMAGSGAGLSESISNMFTLPESVSQSFAVGAQSVLTFAAATAQATANSREADTAYADQNSGLLNVADSAKKAGKSALQMADDVLKAKEKISDTNLSMANLRGEIQELEAKFPGLTKEIIDNFNAHTAAGNSVASFGDKLGATERRQMFNYLTKLIDMNDANRQLAASNGLVGGSLGTVSDGFMDMVNSMSAGLGDGITELPIVASLLPAATQSMNDSSVATTSMATSTAALNPQLETMAAIHTDSLNPALLLTSTYLPLISESWTAITEAITLLTTTPLPSLATALTTTINPALLTMQTQVDALGNTSLANLSNMILSQVMPALGQMFTALSTQVTPAMLNATTQSNLLTAAAVRLVEAGNQVVDVSNKIRSVMLKEIEVVKKLAEFYLALAEARREANRALGTGGTPVPPDAGAGFARGGSFIVPSGYPSSGYGMPMRVHSGELVKVFTAAQTRQMARSQGNSRIVSNSNSTTTNSNRVVNFNITTQQPSKSILNDLAFAKAKYGVF